MFKARLIDFLYRFRDDARGAVSVEFVMMMPLLFWAHMAIYVFFDGYRQSTINLKAAYTIGDVISRETQPIDDEYLDTLYNMLQFLTRPRAQTGLRVTIVRFDAEDDRYYVDWSVGRGTFVNDIIDDNRIAELDDQLPTMPDQERVIFVETQNIFVPLFKVGLPEKPLENRIFTRPRFAPQVVWESS